MSISLVNSKRIIQKWRLLKLKPKELKFLATYVNNHFNATQAYIDTMAKKGTSYSAASTEAYNLLKKPHIKQAMDIWRETFLESVKTQLEVQIITHLMARAFYDIQDYMDERGNLKSFNELSKEQRMAIDWVDKKLFGKNATEVIAYKMADKDKARQELEKYIDMVQEHLDISVKTDFDKKTGELLDIAINNYQKNKQLKA